mgnify:CR=1 FL=1
MAHSCNLRQQFVEPGFEAFVDIRAGFVKNQYRRVGDDGTSQQCALQLPALSCPMERCSSPSSPMRAIICLPFSFCSGVKREVSDFCMLSPERITSSTDMGKFPVDRAVLRQVAQRRLTVETNFPSGGL